MLCSHKATVKRLIITDKAIKEHAGGGFSALSDIRSQLIFRYSRTTTEKGSFYLRHYQGGSERMPLIGRYPDLNTKQARVIYQTMKSSLYLSPKADALIDRFDTLGQTLAWFRGRVERNNEITKGRRKAVTQCIDNLLMPKVKDIKVLEVSRNRIDEALVIDIRGSYSPGYCRFIVGTLKQACRQAKAMNLLTMNPFDGWGYKEFGTVRAKPKPPTLTNSDIREVVGMMPPAGRVRLLMQIMLSLGTRIGETASLRWKWVDWRGQTLRIPAAITKNKVQHDIPLTPQVVDLLQRHKLTQRRNCAFIFPGRPGKSLDVSALHKELKAATGGAWSSHELRKLASTLWGEQGVEKYIIERLLNHSKTDLDAAYNAALLMTQKRAALLGHSESLEAIGAYF